MEVGRHGLIGDDALNRLMADVDARLLECDSEEGTS